MRILDNLSSYLPYPIAARLLQAPDRIDFGWNERLDATVLSPT